MSPENNIYRNYFSSFFLANIEFFISFPFKWPPSHYVQRNARTKTKAVKIPEDGKIESERNDAIDHGNDGALYYLHGYTFCFRNKAELIFSTSESVSF